ncbi:MAG: class I poly(R)-hydroxyalkanoic acid synthase [Actinomycetota bacterium]|jgi:polyhydroxyalkanoate synthase|nr:class I poly(R)-hydroxyalkanoic acid synthase [Actinomycetota bacterium]
MTDSTAGNGGGDPGAGGTTPQATPMAPLEMWSQWFTNNMGNATPGGSIPWLTKPGIPTQGDFEGLPKGVIANDPLLSALEKLWDANPMQNVLPINWLEITRALQTLWIREMSDPGRAMEAAAEFNARMWRSTFDVWQDAMSRMWGLPAKEGEEEESGRGTARADKRFSAPEWEANPYYQTLKESYLLASEFLMREAEETDGDGDTDEQRRLKFYLRQFIDAMAPANFLLTNPAALRRIAETGGTSLAEGTRNLLNDLREGRLSMTDANAFKPGKNLAITPGKVVYQNELVQLIQYEPTVEKVHETPIVFFPPWINKYYILDLQPKNSMVKYLLDQGYQVFMTSWKNPDASLEHLQFEDYMTLGPLSVVDVVRDITGAEKVNPVGYCVGGTLLSVTLAWLAEGGDENPFNASTFMVAMQDFSDVGETSVFIDEPQIEFMEQQMMERGYLDNRKMANMFNSLRANDLIWSNVVNNYLLGQKPPAFDLLYWNSDGTRMARDAHSFYLRNTYLENNLVKPGKVTIKDRPIDLTKITGDIYAVGAEKDHIVPWYSAWQINKIAKDANVRYTLANSGHIAGMINPPSKGKGTYWVIEDTDVPETAEQWKAAAKQHEGSWWEDWTAWLAERSGEMVDPPGIGSEKYPPLEDAPGSYVRET